MIYTIVKETQNIISLKTAAHKLKEYTDFRERIFVQGENDTFTIGYTYPCNAFCLVNNEHSLIYNLKAVPLLDYIDYLLDLGYDITIDL